MHQGDYASYYQYPPNPNPNPSSVDPNLNQTTPYASAPPFSTHDYPSPYHSYYPQNPDPTPAPTLQPPFPSYDPHGPPNQTPTPSANQPPPYFPPFDHHQTAPVPPNPAPTSPPFASMYAPPYNSVESTAPVSGPYDPGMAYFEDKYGGGYNRSLPGLAPGSGSDPYGKRAESAQYDDVYGDGVYQYNGGKAEPYGARGTAPQSSTWSGFDDFGRPISFPSGNDSFSGGSGLDSGMAKIVRAVPKVEAQQDVKGGVQKFRVKLLAESAGQGTMDVLCQIGLDGIRMLDPNTIQTLRIYPLENITRCDKFDSSTFAFWSKSSVDNEPRRIRLQSNSYTTNTLLDTVTAATVQIKEMGGRIRPTSKTTDQPAERKKGLVDWMNIIKPGNEEKDHWVPDEAVSKCTGCGSDFSAFVRRHHCRNCGDVFCDKCTQGRIALTAEENAQPVRVCDHCMAEVTQRLSNAKESASQPAGFQSHEDLAKKLQDEMEKNRKSSGSMSNGSGGMQMKEVACPTCTVHLQVQVPASGSETVECGVCQHPFLVSAH